MTGGGISAERLPGASRGDEALGMAIALAAGVGLMALYSASYAQASRFRSFPEYYLVRQAAFMVAGALGALILSRMRPEALRSKIMPLTIAVLALQVLPLLPFAGAEKNGARRWIDIGFIEFQPSEFLKPVLALYLAHILAKKEEEGKSLDLVSGVLPPMAITAVAAILVFLQNDLSSAIIVLATGLAAFWISGIPLRVLAAIAGLFVPLGTLTVLTSDYRFSRVVSMLFPGYDPRGIGYQLLGSLTAVRSGGLFGAGIGMGTRKVSGVSEVQTDFIFASVAEEGGFIGVLAVMGVFSFLLYRAFRASARAGDSFGRYLAFTLASSLAVQVLMNLGVVAGVVPPTGITLPLFSSGGSSVAVTLCILGLIYGVSRRGEVRNG